MSGSAYITSYEDAHRKGVPLSELHAIIRADAKALAGGVDDLSQRAAVYQQVYRDSGGRFHFPLVASHGALWAKWYLVAARLAANLFAVGDITCGLSRADKMRTYVAFVDAIKAINVSVMVEAYTCYYLYRTAGAVAAEELCLSPELAEGFETRWGANPVSRGDSPAEARAFYECFFRWEQKRVVGPAVDAALDAFEWPFMRALCMRPWVWFSYFRVGRALIFRNFADPEERIAKGLVAFDGAARMGWDRIDRNCRNNPFRARRIRAATSPYCSVQMVASPAQQAVPAARLA